MSTIGKEAGKCPYCETKMVNSGAPIWEDYCPNKDCTGHRDALIASIRERLAETVRQERIRDAAPDMLAALEFVQSDPCFGQLGSVTQDEVRLALSRAKGEE